MGIFLDYSVGPSVIITKGLDKEWREAEEGGVTMEAKGRAVPLLEGAKSQETWVTSGSWKRPATDSPWEPPIGMQPP